MWGWIKSAASAVASWVDENKAAIASTVAAVVVGVVVTVAVGAFIAGTGGLGAVAIAAIAGGAGGMAGGATGYLVDVGLDPRRDFSGGDLAKAVVIGGLVGAATGGLAKGLGGGAAQAAEQTAARVSFQEAAKRSAVNGAIGGAIGAGTQATSNAIDNVLEGRPIANDLGRGVPGAAAVGVGIGVGTTLAEPLVEPLLERVAATSAGAGRSLAGKAASPAHDACAVPPSRALRPDLDAPASAAPVSEAPIAGGAPRGATRARGPPPPAPKSEGIARALDSGKGGGGSGSADAAPATTEPAKPASSAKAHVYRGIAREDPQYWDVRNAKLGEEVTIEPVKKGRGADWRQNVWVKDPELARTVAGRDGVVVRRRVDGTEANLPHGEVHVEGEQKGRVAKPGVSINEEFGEPDDVNPPRKPLDSRKYEPLPGSRELAGDVEPGEYVFVRAEDGKLFVAPNGEHHHPQVLGRGRRATMAGTIKIGANGEIIDICNDSGTFRFSKDTLHGVKEQAVKQGLKWTRKSRLTPWTPR